MTVVENILRNTIDFFPGLKKEVKKIKTYRTEVQLLQRKHTTKNLKQSILHFSINKAATQTVKQIIVTAGVDNGMSIANLHGYAFDYDLPFFDSLSPEDMLKYKHVFKPRGYVYTSFGGYIENIDLLDKYRIVLMVRDPRDILVSNYFSRAHSHREPLKTSSKYADFIEERKEVQRMTIDEYVLEEYPRVKAILERYASNLVNSVPNTYVTRYEDMIENFPKWLDNLLSYCELPIENWRREKMINRHQRKPQQEDVNQHIRKGVSGDYKQKLSAETITVLNQHLKTVLHQFGYNI